MTFEAAERKRRLGTAKALSEARAIYESIFADALRVQNLTQSLEAALKALELDVLLFKQPDALACFERLLPFTTQLSIDNQLRLAAGRAVAHLTAGNLAPAESLFFTTICPQLYRVSDLRARAEIHQALGEYDYQRGLHEAAQAEYWLSAQAWESVAANQRGQATVMLRRGQVFSELGRAKASLETLSESLRLWESLQDQRGLAETRAALGRLHTRRGDQQAALQEFKTAENIAIHCDDTFGKADVLSGQGWIYETLGEYSKAQERYQNALRLFTELGFQSGQAELWGELGRIYYLQSNDELARQAYTQYHALSQEMRNQRNQAYALSGLGRTLSRTANKAEALQVYEEALPILRQAKDARGEAYLLGLIGQFYQEQSRLPEAQQALTDSLKHHRDAEDSVQEALTRYRLAYVLWRQGNLILAQEHVQQSLMLIESLRTKVARQDLRTSLLASVQPVYELALQLAMEQSNSSTGRILKAEAFHLAERARARGLLDALNEARVLDLSQAAPDLLAKQRDMQQQLNAATNRAIINQLIDERNEIEARIRASHPRYAALVQPQPLTLPQVQAQLDEQTLLLEYALGESHSYVWAITKQSWEVYPLAPRAEIEKAAAETVAFLLPDQPLQGLPRLHAYEAAATKLSNLLLAPVAGHLKNRSLLIVADGALQYVPFAALAQPRKSVAPIDATFQSAFQPLMLRHEISHLPSASALAFLRTQSLRQRARSGNIYAFADPVFSPQDERWGKEVIASEGGSSNQVSTLRAGSTAGQGETLARLAATAKEAQSIAEFVPAALIREGKSATVEAVKNLPAQHHRVVHLATHARPDRENADRSTIFLSAMNERNQLCLPQLSLSEIYQLPWSADLVVLSACETALGQEVKGEGLVNLGRGFMYSGSPRVLASLWQVQDNAAYELMRSFYRHHLNASQSPRAALRAAQISLWNNTTWHAPWYWAAFTLQGEFK